jgi:hypothetical protein
MSQRPDEEQEEPDILDEPVKVPPWRCPHCGYLLPTQLPRKDGHAYCPNCLLPLTDEHYA